MVDFSLLVPTCISGRLWGWDKPAFGVLVPIAVPLAYDREDITQLIFFAFVDVKLENSWSSDLIASSIRGLRCSVSD